MDGTLPSEGLHPWVPGYEREYRVSTDTPAQVFLDGGNVDLNDQDGFYVTLVEATHRFRIVAPELGVDRIVPFVASLTDPGNQLTFLVRSGEVQVRLASEDRP